MRKLTLGLPVEMKNEILPYWCDYNLRLRKEGRLVNKVNSLEILLEILELLEKRKKFFKNLLNRARIKRESNFPLHPKEIFQMT